MPRQNTHIIIGAAVGALVDLTIQSIENAGRADAKIDWGRVALCAGVGAVAATLPDIIEPATNPNHRGFFHSVGAGAAVAWICTGGHTKNLEPGIRVLLAAVAVGYGSHIFADSLTPRSIRLV